MCDLMCTLDIQNLSSTIKSGTDHTEAKAKWQFVVIVILIYLLVTRIQTKTLSVCVTLCVYHTAPGTTGIVSMCPWPEGLRWLYPPRIDVLELLMLIELVKNGEECVVTTTFQDGGPDVEEWLHHYKSAFY